MKIRFYWPKKKVPSWLEYYHFENKNGVVIDDPKAKVFHDGFGVIFTVNDRHIAWHLSGCFIRVQANSNYIYMKGQGRGVCMHPKLSMVLGAIRSERWVSDERP